MTQAQLADLAGMTRQAVVAIERGHVEFPSLANAMKLARALGQTIEELFDPDDGGNRTKPETEEKTMADQEQTTEIPTAEALTAQHGVWGEHPTWPSQDWKYEVDNGDTRIGYWEWVVQQMELHS